MPKTADEEFVFKPANSPKTSAAPTLNVPQLNTLFEEKILEFRSRFHKFSMSLAGDCELGGGAKDTAAFEIEDYHDPTEAPVTSPKPVDNKEEIAALDERERELFASMKAAAAEFWSAKHAEWASQHQSHLQQQATRLAASNDLQERLLNANRDFDLRLFEEVISACGRGRDSTFAKERMSRFWECLLRDDGSVQSKTDDLLQDLLGK